MKNKATDEILLRSFYTHCGAHLPQTNEKIRRILISVAGTWINPTVKPDEFSDEFIRLIKKNLYNSSKRDELILEALRSYEKVSFR